MSAYTMCQGATSQTYSITINFTATTPFKITGIQPALRATTRDSGGNVIAATAHIKVSINNVLIQETTVTVDNDQKDYYSAALNVTADIGDIITIVIDYPSGGGNVYYAGLQQRYIWGCTGNNFTAPSISCADMTLYVDYTPVWVIDSANDGYPHIPDAITNFRYFEKDANGYPRNWGVWKLDNQNDGYPWIVGYVPYSDDGYLIYEKTSSGLTQLFLFEKTVNGLIPLMVLERND